jgi:ABC-type multidrug transport system ATPase subunit
MYNGKIALPMFKLFPGAKDIEEITRFLMDVFALKPSSIPESLTDCPHSKLSGGELQRYVVASQIWRVLRVNPDMLILDEVDRALDKETAVKVMSWIVSNVKCFFVIVTHLTEVKQMLLDRQCVSQIWTYETQDTDSRLIRIVPHIV